MRNSGKGSLGISHERHIQALWQVKTEQSGAGMRSRRVCCTLQDNGGGRKELLSLRARAGVAASVAVPPQGPQPLGPTLCTFFRNTITVLTGSFIGLHTHGPRPHGVPSNGMMPFEFYSKRNQHQNGYKTLKTGAVMLQSADTTS